jgi:hypothetical protein
MTTRENIELLRAQIHYYAAEEARSSAPERERAYAPTREQWCKTSSLRSLNWSGRLQSLRKTP